jgi:hypothetical protein
VVIITRPEVTEHIVRDCRTARVGRVWMHQSLAKGTTSVSPDAVDYCRRHDISVIAGACPMMYGPGVDVGHHVAVDTGESGGELTEPRTDLQYRASTVRADEFTLIGQITRLTVIAFEVASRGGVEGVGNATGAVLGALCRHVCLRASVRDRCYRSVVRS